MKSCRSLPAQNPAPSPLSSSARTLSSRAGGVQAASSASYMAKVIALRFSGRFRRRWQMPAALSTQDQVTHGRRFSLVAGRDERGTSAPCHTARTRQGYSLAGAARRPRGSQRRGLPRAPAACRRASSSALSPRRSCSTWSVCSPNSGGARRYSSRAAREAHGVLHPGHRAGQRMRQLQAHAGGVAPAARRRPARCR